MRLARIEQSEPFLSIATLCLSFEQVIEFSPSVVLDRFFSAQLDWNGENCVIIRVIICAATCDAVDYIYIYVCITRHFVTVITSVMLSMYIKKIFNLLFKYL